MKSRSSAASPSPRVLPQLGITLYRREFRGMERAVRPPDGSREGRREGREGKRERVRGGGEDEAGVGANRGSPLPPGGRASSPPAGNPPTRHRCPPSPPPPSVSDPGPPPHLRNRPLRRSGRQPRGSAAMRLPGARSGAGAGAGRRGVRGRGGGRRSAPRARTAPGWGRCGQSRGVRAEPRG